MTLACYGALEIVGVIIIIIINGPSDYRDIILNHSAVQWVKYWYINLQAVSSAIRLKNRVKVVQMSFGSLHQRII